MSLLIKALETAEKEKLAEKENSLTGGYVVDNALASDFTLHETGHNGAYAEFEAESADKKYEQDFDFVLAAKKLADQDLSLEDEAGLPPTPLSITQHEKPKPHVDHHVNKHEKLATNKPAPHVPAKPAVEATQRAAAKVFVANQTARAPTSKSALALLGLAGALIIWLGLQGYDYLQRATTPEVVVVKPMPPATPQVVSVDPAVSPADASSTAAGDVSVSQDAAVTQPDAKATMENAAVQDKKVLAVASEAKEVDVSMAEEDEPPRPKVQPRKAANSADMPARARAASSKRESLKLVSKLPSSGVDPTLLAAYQAFTRGEDASAQRQYRQVLQQDVRNVDALLGMAAIAQRQGRNADAIGWYQKVLEIEPRNTFAQSAVASLQVGGDAVGTESRIKNMIAQQPDAAHLHASLGNLYAEQNQWAEAQDAYFNASRYAPNNADYAFNVAVSLDQLGKASLALSQYQRALELLNKSGAASPDRAAIEARIRALQ